MRSPRVETKKKREEKGTSANLKGVPMGRIVLPHLGRSGKGVAKFANDWEEELTRINRPVARKEMS